MIAAHTFCSDANMQFALAFVLTFRGVENESLPLNPCKPTEATGWFWRVGGIKVLCRQLCGEAEGLRHASVQTLQLGAPPPCSAYQTASGLSLLRVAILSTCHTQPKHDASLLMILQAHVQCMLLFVLAPLAFPLTWELHDVVYLILSTAWFQWLPNGLSTGTKRKWFCRRWLALLVAGLGIERATYQKFIW